MKRARRPKRPGQVPGEGQAQRASDGGAQQAVSAPKADAGHAQRAGSVVPCGAATRCAASEPANSPSLAALGLLAGGPPTHALHPMEARKSEAGEQRQVLVCVGERADELQALFNWASSCFFEPRDVVSIMYARFDTAQLMVRCELRLLNARCAHLLRCSIEAVARTLPGQHAGAVFCVAGLVSARARRPAERRCSGQAAAVPGAHHRPCTWRRCG